MTQWLYTTDSYLKTFEATITAIDQEQNGVILDRSAFYPGGGGQPADAGTLMIEGVAYPVKTVKKTPAGGLHILEGPLPEAGKPCTGQLDWERRHRLMRTHTAMHILCGVIWRDYGAQVTGGNMDIDEARMDFELETLDAAQIPEIQAKMNEEVQQNRPVQVKILPREEAFQIPDLIRTKINLLPEGITEIRTVELQGLDLQADGGTHVAATGEVGTVTITNYRSKGKINKRLYLKLED